MWWDTWHLSSFSVRVLYLYWSLHCAARDGIRDAVRHFKFVFCSCTGVSPVPHVMVYVTSFVILSSCYVRVLESSLCRTWWDTWRLSPFSVSVLYLYWSLHCAPRDGIRDVFRHFKFVLCTCILESSLCRTWWDTWRLSSFSVRVLYLYWSLHRAVSKVETPEFVPYKAQHSPRPKSISCGARWGPDQLSVLWGIERR